MQDDWKYCYKSNPNYKDELYNLKEDPKEKMNLIDQYPQKAKELKNKVIEHLENKNDPTLRTE